MTRNGMPRGGVGGGLWIIFVSGMGIAVLARRLSDETFQLGTPADMFFLFLLGITVVVLAAFGFLFHLPARRLARGARARAAWSAVMSDSGDVLARMQGIRTVSEDHPRYVALVEQEDGLAVWQGWSDQAGDCA